MFITWSSLKNGLMRMLRAELIMTGCSLDASFRDLSASDKPSPIRQYSTLLNTPPTCKIPQFPKPTPICISPPFTPTTFNLSFLISRAHYTAFLAISMFLLDGSNSSSLFWPVLRVFYGGHTAINELPRNWITSPPYLWIKLLNTSRKWFETDASCSFTVWSVVLNLVRPWEPSCVL